jgi:hypothetical protein
VVVEVAGPEQGCALALAEASGGTRLPLGELAAGVLLGTFEEPV